jgi:acetyl/propionyl-CoA carboxylase alpha subunit
MRWVVRGSAGSREVEVERSADGFEVTVDGTRHPVDLIRLDGAIASLRYIADGRSYQISFDRGHNHHWRIGVVDREFDFEVLTPVEAIDASARTAGRGASELTAPIPGKVVAVNVAVGDEVEVGQSLVVLEAMKMENELIAEQAGTVAAVHASPGDTVDAGTVLVELDQAP